MAIVLRETQRALFYAPLYVALARDAFGSAGVEVIFQPGAAPDEAVRCVLSGQADVAWGGPMRAIVDHDRDGTIALTCFCEVVTRDPFLLVGARPCTRFTLSSLLAKRIGIVREVPTPWCCLQDDLRCAGIDPATLDVRFDGDMRDNVAALREGRLDVIQTLEPCAAELTSSDDGHVWYAAATRGHTSYTSLYARRSFLSENRSALRAMTRALLATQRWLRHATAADVATTIRPFFPSIPDARLVLAVDRYKALGIWSRDPLLPRSGYERLQRALLAGGLVRSTLPFEAVVDNSFAEEAMSEARISSPALDR